jgi:3-hydroxyacyl-CoA dehydrogenase
MKIVKVGVVGAGAMGSGIAALAASAGVPVVLLDVPGKGTGSDERDAPARGGLQRALKARPAAFMHASRADLVTVGNVDDDLGLLADCDWVIEAIIEQLEPKRALYAKLETLLRPDAIVSSNTSGIPIRALAEGRSETFRRRFIGTHFFNPPRYLHLLEIIPTADTAPDLLTAFRTFGERTLGKGIVVAKDVPGFIANRIGLFGLVAALRLMERFDLTIDEVDALTGEFLGRPKSATFRTGDITGIDVVQHVTRELSAATGEDFALPGWVDALVASGRFGEKSGAGFYRKVGKDIETLDWKSGEYRPAERASLDGLEELSRLPFDERLRALAVAEGRRAEFARTLLFTTAHYAMVRTPELATDIVSVDRALEWGYGWAAGPYAQMDAVGLATVRSVLGTLGLPEPPLLAAAQETFYRHLGTGERQLTFTGQYAPVDEPADQIRLDAPWVRRSAVAGNESAALLDLGGGVLLLEFRGKMNTLDAGVLALLAEAAARVRRGGYAGLVIGNDDPRTFTAGADLAGLLARAERGEWDELDAAVRAFQDAVASLRRVPFPVVVAPFGLTLGGGAEFTLNAVSVQAHAELYMGLVEAGVGLVPGGGGTKELLFRFSTDLLPYDDADPFAAVKRAFQLIALAKTSTSALDARALGLLRPGDGISMNRRRLIADARSRVLELAPGYLPPVPRSIRTLGNEGLGNLYYAAWAAQEAGQASAHDVTIARHVARILCGGEGPPRMVTEQDVLDLEREAFLSLLGTQETRDRIAHMLKTGKPLRN